MTHFLVQIVYVKFAYVEFFSIEIVYVKFVYVKFAYVEFVYFEFALPPPTIYKIYKKVSGRLPKTTKMFV